MRKPYLKLIQRSQAINKALIFFNGYQMRHINQSEIWSQYLCQAGWQGAIYQFWWDGGSQQERIYNMSVLGHIPVVNEIAHTYPHWQMVLKRAKISGAQYLPAILSSIKETNISLIGYSLGCRVIHYGMREFRAVLSPKNINNIILIAGAIRTMWYSPHYLKILSNFNLFC